MAALHRTGDVLATRAGLGNPSLKATHALDFYRAVLAPAADRDHIPCRYDLRIHGQGNTRGRRHVRLYVLGPVVSDCRGRTHAGSPARGASIRRRARARAARRERSRGARIACDACAHARERACAADRMHARAMQQRPSRSISPDALNPILQCPG